MRADDPNLPYLILVAEALGSLQDSMVFVGGCAAGLLLTDPAASRIRVTTDVDAVVETATWVEYCKLEAQMPGRGFVRDAESGVICRWKHKSSGILFDMMPVDPKVLGFSNRWYPEAVRTATHVELREGLSIRLVSAPAFVATKLEAFVDRGKSDLMSHDLEDVLIVVDGRPSLPDEIDSASSPLKEVVQSRLRALLRDPAFENFLPGLIDDADPRGARSEIVLKRLATIAGSTTRSR